MILDKHWWWTNDRERVVPDGHPDAAFLAFAKGHEIADNLAAKYGIVNDDAKAKAKSKADSEGEDGGGDEAKAKPAAANKAKAQGANKSE